MAERLAAWLLSAVEVLAGETGWQADRQMDRQEDRRTGGIIERLAGRETDRKAGVEVARQTCTVGSRTGSWRRKETRGQQVPLAERQSEIEGDRNRGERGRGMRSVHGWLADC